jgi:hypothetical protein
VTLRANLQVLDGRWCKLVDLFPLRSQSAPSGRVPGRGERTPPMFRRALCSLSLPPCGTPPVGADVMAVVASRCVDKSGHSEHVVAHACAVHVATPGGPAGPYTTPPSAGPSARRACVAASRPASTAAPRGWHHSSAPREKGHRGGEDRRSHDIIAPQCLVRRGPHGCRHVAAVFWSHHIGYASEALAMTEHERNRARGRPEVYTVDWLTSRIER